MIRRISTTVAALAVALIIYALFTGLILQRINAKLLPPPFCLHTTHPAAACPAKPSPPGVPIFGVRIPLACVLAAAVTVAALPMFAEYMSYRRRRRRYLDDECIECGRPITSWRGRCPGCGVRIGPGW